MSLAALYYLCAVAGSLKESAWIFLFIAGMGFAILAFIYFMCLSLTHHSDYKVVYDSWRPYLKLIKNTAIAYVIIFVLNIFIPSKTDMLIVSGISAAEQSDLVAKGGETAFKAFKLIDKELDELLKDDKD